MARYVDADRTKTELLENAVRIYDTRNMSTEDAMYIIDEQPTADVVEVVRCEKCKHGDVSIIEKTKDGQERWGCYCNIEEVVHSLDWYCPCGKKK